MKILTKSKYLIGLECPRFLWKTINEPQEIEKPSAADKFKFEEGDKVGELAKSLFKNGVDIPIDNFSENLNKSKILIKEKKPLFEAGFLYKNCFSRADILTPNEDGWDIIEVKSGTKVKDVNIHDVAFQKYVYEGNGIKIKNCYLMHLNKNYIKKGDIEVDKIFIKENINKEVENVINDIENNVKEIFKIVSLDNPPKPNIRNKFFKDGYHDCVTDGCFDLPENHVFCLYRGGKLSCELFEKGIINIKDIPLSVKLNGKQNIQRECETTGRIYVNKEEISNFLKKLKFPLYYLDFETFSTGIPMFDGLKCYSQVPFQFSLHVVEKENSKPIHYEFLYDGDKDPRKDFILGLKKVIGNNGSVVVYNQSFEIGRLKEILEHFPEHKAFVEDVLKRIVDLLVPFREFSYYNPKQQGSASIKDVLPALVGKRYQGMEIGDGGTASVEFFRMAYENCSDEEKKKVRDNLLKYCELDTLAEVMIVEKLKKIV